MAFTSQITGSPFTTPQNNITAMAYTNVGNVKRIYYASQSDFTKIFCMSVTGTADTGREINVQNQGSARTSPIRGLCSDGTYLYAVTGALGNQYIHVYKLSDRTFVASYQLGFHADHYVRGIETFIKPGTTERRIDILQDNIIRSYTVSVTEGTSASVTLTQQTDGTFTLPTNEMVTSGAWQSLAWDSLVDRLLVVAEQQVTNQAGAITTRDKVFGFAYNGSRDDREDFLPMIDGDAMTYNSDDDDLYIIHETSTQLHVWQDAPRWRLGNTDLNITQGARYELDFKPLVDAGSTISFVTDTSSAFYDDLAFGGDYVMVWDPPPAPQGNASIQNLPITMRATHGSNHTDQVFNFVLHAAARTIVEPVFQRNPFPKQTVYEPYTPPPGAPNPNLPHQFQVHLSDFVTAGTPPFNFSIATDGADFPGTANISTRYVNQQPIRDVLTFNARSVTASQLSRHLVVTVSNDAGQSSQNQPFEVVNLIYPSWFGRQSINLASTALQSVNLRDLSSGEPQTSLDIVGAVPSNLTANIVDGQLQVGVHQLPENASTETITVKQTNILTTTDGVQRTFNINIAARPVIVTRVAPEWTPHTLTFRTNRGATGRIELNQYITQGNPAPTFSVSAPEGVLDTIEGRISGQHYFAYSIPDSITTDATYSVDLTARNDLDSAVKTITITGVAITVPVLGAYPHLEIQQGQTLTVDVDDYVIGQRPITYGPQGAISGVSGASLNGSIITYDTSGLMLTRNYDQTIPFTMSNALTENPIDSSIHVQILVVVSPVWQQGPIRLEMLEGETKSFPLGGYVSGHPTPVIDFKTGFIPDILNETIQNNTLTVRNAPINHADTHYRIEVTATSDGQTADKTIDLEVLSQDQFNNTNTFTTNDFNQIRYLLGHPITPFEVPDEVIQSYVYEEASKEWAERIVPNDVNNPLSIVNLKAKKRAVLYRCAALLCGRALTLIEQQVGQIERRFAEIDWNERERSLNQKANYEITRIQRERQGQTLYDFFKLTGG